jgi:hypothetical protein
MLDMRPLTIQSRERPPYSLHRAEAWVDGERRRRKPLWRLEKEGSSIVQSLIPLGRTGGSHNLAV